MLTLEYLVLAITTFGNMKSLYENTDIWQHTQHFCFCGELNSDLNAIIWTKETQKKKIKCIQVKLSELLNDDDTEGFIKI